MTLRAPDVDHAASLRTAAALARAGHYAPLAVRVGMLTREYPPDVYGGAGVHVDFLTRELARLDRRRRALPRRAPARRDRPLRGRSAPRRRQPGAADLRRRPGDGGRRRGVRPRPLPHLVRQPRRAPRQAAPRHPARRHVALARAAAAVEGRAARRRVPPVVVGRADRLRGRRRGDRRQRGVEGRRAAQPTRRSIRRASTSSTTASTSSCTAPTRRPTSSNGSASTCVDRRSSFVGRITRQKGVPHLLRAALQFDERAQIVLLAGAADTPELAAETDAAVAELRDGARRRRVGQRHAAAVRRHPGPQPRHGVRVPVDLRAAGHRQPRGDGVRHGGRRQRRRRHPRGRRRRRDRPARALRRDRTGDVRGRRWPTPSTALVADPDLAAAMGAAGRSRAVEEFGWDVAADAARSTSTDRSVSVAMRLGDGPPRRRPPGRPRRRRRGDAPRRRRRRRAAGRPRLARRAAARDRRRRSRSTSSTTHRSCRGRTRSSASG